MNWNLIIGPGCLLLGILIALYVKDSARSVAKEEFREQIGSALSIFEIRLLRALRGEFILRNECALMMEGIKNRAALRSDVQDRQEQRDSIRLDQQDRHMEFIDHEREK